MQRDIYSTWMKYLGFLLIIFVILTFSNYWIVNRDGTYTDQYTYYANNMRVLSQEIANDTTISFLGNATALDALSYHRDEFIRSLTILRDGGFDPKVGKYLPKSPDNIQNNQLAKIETVWEPFLIDVNTILRLKQVLPMYDEFRIILTNEPKLHGLLTDLIKLMQNNKFPNGITRIPCDQFLLIQRAIRTSNNMLQGGSNNTQDAEQVLTDLQNFHGTLDTLKTAYSDSPDVIAKIHDITNLTDPILDFARGLVENAKVFTDAAASNIQIYNLSYQILDVATALSVAYDADFDAKWINIHTAYALSVISFLILILLIYLGYKNSQMNIQLTREQNLKTQQEIRMLEDEIGELANGNLKVHATVTGGISTAISKAINNAINALRRLVTTIHLTSDQISKQSQNVEQKSRSLAKASENQTHEISGATESINSMSASIEQVSATARDSANVADNSVKIAHEGSQIVQNTIGGMERIREQIQETEKRIRRLGESSQEIGDIVSLMDDIAEQTNILSLNAAIQAAMAGEEGRGFAVVADEVQRLAERSSQAAKEVESLVKTIQSDTSQAAISMERAITEVTQGTKLAEEAGVALEKIETVSKDLASLIQNISEASTKQAQVSSKVARTMRVIKDIAKQTTEGADDSANSIVSLASLILKLRQSIAGFKLPEGALQKAEGKE